MENDMDYSFLTHEEYEKALIDEQITEEAVYQDDGQGGYKLRSRLVSPLKKNVVHVKQPDTLSRPHAFDRRRGCDGHQTRLGKPPHEHKSKKSMLELKITSIHRCRMNQHSAEATHIHFQHKHVQHNSIYNRYKSQR